MLNTLSRCGIQFQRRYGYIFGVWDKEEIIPPGIALVVGIATHKAIEADLRHLIDFEALLEDEAVAEYARDSFIGIQTQDGLMLSPEESVNAKKAIGGAIDMTVALSALHHAEIAPKLKPLAVEEKFVIEIEDYPIDLAGTIDVREDSVLRDTKTRKTKPPEHAAKSIQMAMYSLAEKQTRGKLPDKVVIDALVKTKTPKAISVEAVPSEEWINPLFRRIERFCEIIEAVKKGHQAFTPAQPDDWVCSKKFCGFAETCPFWSGR